MKYILIFLMGLGFSMDAFAVSVCKGVSMKKVCFKDIFTIAFFFGGFQMLMPWLGYIAGNTFVDFIQSFSHWISFALLVFIGIKMCVEAFEENNETNLKGKLNFKELFALALATSIDALAGGFTLSASNDSNILLSISIIGAVTFVLCAIGVIIGFKFGSRFKIWAEIAGGIILITVGIKLLLDGLLK